MKTKEIERKYLVCDDGWKASVEKSSTIRQAYLPDAAHFPSAHLYLDNDLFDASKKLLKFHFRDPQNDFTITVLKDISATLAAVGEEVSYFFDERLVKVGNDVEARVRQKDDKYFITLKANTAHEDTRLELELPIEKYCAEKIFERCGAQVEKTRYIVPAGNGLKFEVDVFGGLNEGLVTTEIELERSSQKISLPAWVGADVTGDKSYSNRALAENPKAKPFSINENHYKFLIVHGVDGYPTKNWYGAIAETLRTQGHEVVVPQFPTQLPRQAPGYASRAPIYDNYGHQTLADWLPIAEKAIEGWDRSDVIVIGHSLGGALANRIAEKLGREKPFRAIFEVAPVGGALEGVEIDPSFYQDVDWKKAKAGAKQFTILAAPDDEVVPFSQPVGLARKLGANLVLIRNGGHLNADSGFTDLPRLMTEIERLTKPKPVLDLGRSNSALVRQMAL